MNTRFLIGGVLLASTFLLHSTPLTESTFTDIVRTVDVLAQPAKNATPASLNEVFKSPDLVRTGVGSRAELTAPDQTITRVGANTVFSFAPSSREIDLEQGSVLFHSPSGRGGGMIKSGGASAAVSGTTLIVATTPVTSSHDQNGFKVILLEGHGRVTLGNGKHRNLKAGEMVYVLPNQGSFGPVLTINLGKLVAGSTLVNGFSHELPSFPLIQLAIDKQIKLLKNGRASDTGMPADNFINYPPPSLDPFGGPHNGDPNIIQIGVNYPIYQNIGRDKGTAPVAPTLPGGVFAQMNYFPPVNLPPEGVVIILGAGASSISHSESGAHPILPPIPESSSPAAAANSRLH